ncbi:MAG: HEAT repeat domain-containing protein [Verrucomicrobia bacterium]|nr:HEAT repeat domain-containing protein [Verrucomicrobiota bacterium]
MLLSAAEVETPFCNDPQLELRLVAAEPQIMTPIGAAVDAKGRLFVIESHSHHTKPDYPGPRKDRVLMWADSDGDGVPDRRSVFADGFHHAMTLAFSPRGALCLVHRNGVVALHDRDGDGVSESQSKVLELETTGTYPHDGLSGIAFSRDGWLYIGMGENLGAPYTLHGTDGSRHSGGGEGGHIFRCRPDGRELQHVATGLWNPFGLEFDRAGNLFAVDNDPDSRPPCRLLHVVEGGDYGFKFRLGRNGLHPFLAWNGELPGTLPMAAGTGEAPSGILLADHAALPASYRGAFLVTSWGDHAIEVYRPKPSGASWRAVREVLVHGGQWFRPVSIVAAPDGAIYITDWVDQSYPVHGKGRIWRLAAKRGVEVARPDAPGRPAAPNPAAERMQRLLKANSPARARELLAGLDDVDPFIRSAAIHALSRPVLQPVALKATHDPHPLVRTGALVALRRANYAEPAPILRRALADADDHVRFVALQWIGEGRLTALSDAMDAAFNAGNLSPTVFHAYLAAAELLAAPTNGPSSLPSDAVRGKIVERLLNDDTKPAGLRAMAVAMVPNLRDRRIVERLAGFARGGEPLLRVEAVRTLAGATNATVAPLFQEIALDRANPAGLRADAIAALARQSGAGLGDLTALLDDPAPAVQIETARALRTALDQEPVRAALRKECDSLAGSGSALAEQLRFALRLPDAQRPADHAAWPAMLQQGGDSDSGRRLFFHPQVGCAKCHPAEGRGGRVGPDLSTIASASDRQRLIQSILEPSREIAPQFEQHVVETKDGQTYTGVWLNAYLDGSLLLSVPGMGQVRIPGPEIVSHRTSELSLMPEGLENGMTVQDFRDLLAFLLSLK